MIKKLILISGGKSNKGKPILKHYLDSVPFDVDIKLFLKKDNEISLAPRGTPVIGKKIKREKIDIIVNGSPGRIGRRGHRDVIELTFEIQ